MTIFLFKDFHYLCLLDSTNILHLYTDSAGLEIPIDLCIASPFSRQKANGNGGPASALDSMGGKLCFCCHSVNVKIVCLKKSCSRMEKCVCLWN